MAVRPPSPPSFEAALTELESIVQSMETGEMPLETALSSYQRGTVLLKYCQEQLSSAEQKIRVLEGNTLRPLGNASDNPADQE
ncbi:MAG: exodeoxyribonuclease VII small subunit [Proteobacteria bacterium]|nr:exodeoxyribonuclease VII small subunit [Pseudomonadota bacterium]HQR03140.1 exodeoxyribonuclease VII small subunit [Rhodocyclaceae bacterium]